MHFHKVWSEQMPIADNTVSKVYRLRGAAAECGKASAVQSVCCWLVAERPSPSNM